MKKALVDTNIISAFMRGNSSVIQKVEKYLRFHKTLSVSVITYYEIIRGLKAISNINKLTSFKNLMSACEILDLDFCLDLSCACIRGNQPAGRSNQPVYFSPAR